MKPCTSYVQTLFTGRYIFHWILHMTKSGRSFLSTSICSLSPTHDVKSKVMKSYSFFLMNFQVRMLAGSQCTPHHLHFQTITNVDM